MKFCSHCGNQIADNVEICMNCGCLVKNKHTITFKRDSQWFLVNPPINVDITGEGCNETLAIKNGATDTISLPSGKYNLHFYSSIRTVDCALDLNKDTAYHLGWNRASGKLEVWEI